MALSADHADLELEGVIGLSGSVMGGVRHSPCGAYVLYPLGSNVVVKNLDTGGLVALQGHDGDVSCVAVSRDGTMAASGQSQHLGVKADAIVWDLAEAKRACDAGESTCAPVLYRLRQHLGGVAAADFSCDSRYLATLGQEDDNALVVWDLEAGRPICGAPAHTETALALKWLNGRPDRLVTAGHFHLRVWQVDASFPKMHAVNARCGSLRRVIQCLDVTADDAYALCGTRTGDLVRFAIARDEMGDGGRAEERVPNLDKFTRDKFVGGVRSVRVVPNPRTGRSNYLVGGGDGAVAYVNESMHRVSAHGAALSGAVTSISSAPGGGGFLAATAQSNLYALDLELRAELLGTCHHGGVNGVVFPRGCSDLFLTCSREDIRVWRASGQKELLRIQVLNLECNCVAITDSGTAIVSGWDDGRLRAFAPESGRLLFVVPDAHAGGATAIAATRDAVATPPWRVVSGGADGRVRVWSVTSSHQSLLSSMKEHRGPVNALAVSPDNARVVSASSDGSCIVWDLERCVRVGALFEPTVFRGVAYHPDESQLLTCGANFKVTYWDAAEGDMIRVLDAADKELCALDVDGDGASFVTGGADGLVKVWSYDDGLVTATGRGHGATVRAVRVSPDKTRIVSVGSEGSIFLWRNPQLPSPEAPRGP